MPGEGVVLALTHDGRLLRHKHRGWLGPREIASSIGNATLMFVLMLASVAAVPPVR